MDVIDIIGDIVKRYTGDHEWVEQLSDTKVRIGITDYAQKSLGDLVYVELPKIGSSVKTKQMVGVVESVKGASDVYSPVTGKVVAVNENAKSKPSLINKSPEQDGWLCEVEMTSMDELNNLYDGEGYRDFCKGCH